MAESELVLVVGGTRGTGRLIVDQLLRHDYRVRIMARDPVKARRSLPVGIEIVEGDLTRPATLPPAVSGAGHIIVTAGVRSGRYAPESLVKATDHDGVVAIVDAALAGGFSGRFLYMNSIGINTRSFAAGFINLLKRNTLLWRRKLEDRIRASGLDYTIIRVGFLTDQSAAQREIVVSQDEQPLSFRRRIARADVAEIFVAALRSPFTHRVSFEIVNGRGSRTAGWDELLGELRQE